MDLTPHLRPLKKGFLREKFGALLQYLWVSRRNLGGGIPGNLGGISGQLGESQRNSGNLGETRGKLGETPGNSGEFSGIFVSKPRVRRARRQAFFFRVDNFVKNGPLLKLNTPKKT